MYNEFFGFEKNPFASKPDPAFFYRSKQHDTALRSLTFAVQARMGLSSLTGEEGTGKTTVLEGLRDSLESANIRCAFFRDSRISTNRFFQTIAADLDLRCQETSAYQVFSALHQFMIQQARKGRTVALLVDEAHNLPAAVFNEIMHLASLDDDRVKLIQTVLAGRPELHPTLDTLNLERLKQSAILSCNLHPFAAQETKEYIEFRLAQAGMSEQTVFPPEAIAEVHDRSRGFAPVIHGLCERLLLAAFSARSRVCTQETLDQVFQKPPAKQPQIVEITGTVEAVTRIEPAFLAPLPEPEPPPMKSALLRLDFDALPGLPPPLPVSGSELSDLQGISLLVVLPPRNSDLPVAELATGSNQDMRLANAAKPASSVGQHVHPIPSPSIVWTTAVSRPVSKPAMSRPVVCAELRAEGELLQIGVNTAANGLRSVLPAIPFNQALPCHPKASAGKACQGCEPPIQKLIPLERYVMSRTPLAGGPVGADSISIPSAPSLQPICPAATFELARTNGHANLPVTPFQISKCDPASPSSSATLSGDVQACAVNLKNPMGPAFASELLASGELNLPERNNLLLLPYSVRPTPPAEMPVEAYPNILPPLEAWCPQTKLEAVNPRSSFLLLSSPEASLESKKPPFRYEKWLLNLAIVVLAGIALYTGPPAIRTAANVAQQGWRRAHQTAIEGAAVELKEDFRSGLDDWMNRGGARPSWTSDAAGFVHPSTLALYRPSLSLADYELQFMGMIDKKGLSWVVRAADFNNYYVVRLTVLRPGPVPAIGVTRYAVIDGRMQNSVTTPLVMSARSDTIYRVRVDVRGDHFALSVQDRPADSWSEPRLPQGGIGFFSEQDAGSRITSVQVRGQFDMLGRLWALLMPSDVASYRGSLNQRAARTLLADSGPNSAARGDLFASLPGFTSQFPRGTMRLDPTFWQVPEVALARTRHCASPATRVGVVRARQHASPFTGFSSSFSSSLNCY